MTMMMMKKRSAAKKRIKRLRPIKPSEIAEAFTFIPSYAESVGPEMVEAIREETRTTRSSKKTDEIGGVEVISSSSGKGGHHMKDDLWDGKYLKIKIDLSTYKKPLLQQFTKLIETYSKYVKKKTQRGKGFEYDPMTIFEECEGQEKNIPALARRYSQRPRAGSCLSERRKIQNAFNHARSAKIHAAELWEAAMNKELQTRRSR